MTGRGEPRVSTDMTRGNILRQLIQFSIPLILGNLFQLSYNMVDTIVIGRFAGSTALAAVGTCDQVMNLLILGVSGICIGASVLMGNFFGAGDHEKLLEEMKTMVVIGLLATLTQISVRVTATLLLTPVMGIAGLGLACVLGWTVMIAWELPVQLYIRRRGVLEKQS